MGTWDSGSFDNDTAGDWTYELEETEDLSLIESTIERVLAVGPKNEVPADAAECAVAAAATLARLQGWRPEETSYTETVDTWVKDHPIDPPAALVAKARAALSRVMTAPSELLDLWEEGGSDSDWREAVEEVRAQLREAR